MILKMFSDAIMIFLHKNESSFSMKFSFKLFSLLTYFYWFKSETLYYFIIYHYPFGTGMQATGWQTRYFFYLKLWYIISHIWVVIWTGVSIWNCVIDIFFIINTISNYLEVIMIIIPVTITCNYLKVVIIFIYSYCILIVVVVSLVQVKKIIITIILTVAIN